MELMLNEFEDILDNQAPEAQMPERWKDPRPDLPDHDIWQKILITAFRFDPELFPILHGLRCCEAGLIRGKFFKLNLDPLKSNFCSEEEYQKFYSKYLEPNKDKIKRIFEQVREGL